MTCLQRERPTGTTVAVSPPHDIDVATVRRFRAALFDAIETGRPRDVVVEMAGVEFCDSTGLAALVAAHHRAAGRGVRFTVSDPPPSLTRLLRLTGVGRVLAIRTGAA